MLVDPTVPVHPTFFYEFVWNLLGFLLLAFVLTPRRRYDGQVSLGYMAWYGLGRFFIEGLRTDSLMLGSYRVSQLLALALCAGSVLLMAVLWLRTRKVPAVLYVDTEASRQRMAKVDAELSKNGGGGGDAPAGDEPLSGDSGDDVVVSTADGCEGTGPSPEGAGEAEEASTESAGEAEEASTESVGEAEEASTESAGEAEGTSTESAGEAEEASTESIKETEKASDKDAGEVVENAPNGGEETETPENTAK